MADIDDDIVKVVVNFSPLPVKTVNTGINLVSFANTLNIGSNARFVAIPGGIKLEVKNSSNVWVEQWEYTEP